MNNIIKNSKVQMTFIISILISLIFVIDVYWLDIFFKSDNILMFFLLIVVSNILMSSVFWAESENDIFIREIPGIKAMEEAVGRATEMGKPVLFVPGILDLNEVETIAGINILGHVAKITAEYETSLNVPVSKSVIETPFSLDVCHSDPPSMSNL